MDREPRQKWYLIENVSFKKMDSAKFLLKYAMGKRHKAIDNV